MSALSICAKILHLESRGEAMFRGNDMAYRENQLPSTVAST